MALAATLLAAPRAGAQSVLTYHNDTLRTGWNRHETVLNTATVAGGSFNLLASVPLDGQVDAQPLVVSGQMIAGQGPYQAVYVATSNDTVYAIDGATGNVLLSQNFGTPLPQWALPGQCYNNAPSIGIDSTPVISTATNTLYVVTDTYENGAPVFRLHALALDTLQDQVPPVVITASHQLTDGSTFTMDPTSSRQRAALLLSGSTVYAAFASYCDNNANLSRGWLLGWNAQTLAPLSGNELTNQLTTSPNSFFLSSIWMGGFGPATPSANGPVFFNTGNSDYSGTSYNATTNLSESLVEMAPDLSHPISHFTPSNHVWLDKADGDLGSGGAMLLPGQPGQTPRLAVVAGKDGNLYLLNRGHLKKPLGTYAIGDCWCGPSYFTGADGIARIVTSGGANLMTWLVNTSPNAPASLSSENSTPITSGQDPGFFTSVSSNGTQPGSAVIWAVGRPVDSDPANITLYAFDPVSGNVIYSSVAGTWPNTGGNANIVPTIAGGRVFVASDQELAIFGLGTPAPEQRVMAVRAAAARASRNILVLAPGEHAIYGKVVGINQSVVTLRERTGTLLLVDTAQARRNSGMAVAVVGHAMLAIGRYAHDGVMTASYMQRAKNAAALWPADR